jgi:hypothetical protein
MDMSIHSTYNCAVATELRDPESVRLAALTALRGWAIRRDRLPAERAGLLEAAWRAGARNVRELARIADVSRDTVYSDLKSRGIDPSNRSDCPPPRYQPLRCEDVKDLADIAASMLVRAMLTNEPGPLADAAWQAQIVLTRVAELLDPSPREGFDRAGAVEDVGSRGDSIRQAAHRLLAAENSADALADRTERDRVLRVGEQAQVLSAQLRLLLPNAELGTIDVELADADHTHVRPAWTTWRSDSQHLVGEVDSEAHLEIASALDRIGAVLTRALGEGAFDGA